MASTVYTFTQQEKLKSKKLIEIVFAQAQAFNAYPYKVLYYIVPTTLKLADSKAYVPQYPVKFGITVPSKHHKKAVDRNRLKRITREAWRLQKQNLYNVLLKKNAAPIQLAIFVIYTPKTILCYTQAYDGITKAITKLIKTLETPHP